jgi:hypothetical protein
MITERDKTTNQQRRIKMNNTNYTRYTDKFATNLRIMRGCFNTALPFNGYHDYTKECRIANVESISEKTFNKYMIDQMFGYLKERDFNRLYSVMVHNNWTLKKTASHVKSALILNGVRTDI